MFYFIQAIKKSFVFSGRATRKEYLHFMITVEIAYIILELLPFFINNEITDNHAITILVFGVVVFFPALAVSIRRLHDIGVSGWWFILVLAYRRILLALYMNNVFNFGNEILEASIFLSLHFIPTIILGSLPSSSSPRGGGNRPNSSSGKKFNIK